MNVIIVLNYNDYKTTIDFIENFKNYSILDKIIIVDNNSTDGSYKKLLKYSSKKIDVIKTNKNGGYAYGNAFGVEYGLNTYNVDKIYISNPDIFANEECLIEMARVLDTKKDVGILSCMVSTPENVRKLPSAWKLPSYYDCLRELLPSRFQKRAQYADDYFLQNNIVPVDVIPGSLFAMKASVYKKLGGFDTNTFLYYEENILAFQLKKQGLTNYIITTFFYTHYVSQSIIKSQSSLIKRLRILEQSREYYCSKYLRINLPQKMLLKLFFCIISLILRYIK